MRPYPLSPPLPPTTPSPQGDETLLLECESDGTYVVITHVSLEPKAGFDSESMFTGPVFEELDENLQREFQAYLVERGVTEVGGRV